MKKNKEKIELWYDDNKHKYEALLKKGESIIEAIIRFQGIQINSINGRIKTKESFSEKALKDKYKDPINEITDIAGIRVITYVNSDVEKISKIIEEEFQVDWNNSVDKGKLLGVNKVGYKSVHYVVKLSNERAELIENKDFKDMYFEIQIRTLLQHAWSEIEHDRNYKFSGVLPEDIRRKFALLSGTLELVDMQFEEISNQIDNYAKDVSSKLDNGDLKDILIDSTSIKEYMMKKFKTQIDDKHIRPTMGINEKYVIKELYRFGINTIGELEELLEEDLVVDDGIIRNFSGVLRNYMIAKDAKKYFTKCLSDNWKDIGKKGVHILKKNNVDIKKLIDEIT